MYKFKGGKKEHNKAYFRKYRKTHPKKVYYACDCIICKSQVFVERYRINITKFCSRQCYWKFLVGKPNLILKRYGKTRIGKRNSFFGKRHTVKTKKLISESRKGKYCGELNHNWRNNSSLEEYGKAFNSRLREQIRFRDNYKCQLCGCPQIENYRRLDIHHEDYDKKNNAFNNLISLCHSCHLKTNYNRPYWIQYFKDCGKAKSVEYVTSDDEKYKDVM